MRNKERENMTLRLMAETYCKGHHGNEARAGVKLCPECEKVVSYAEARTTACPLGEEKTTCRRCTIHCYQPTMREAIRRIMHYAGPRMLFLHPASVLRHIRGRG